MQAYPDIAQALAPDDQLLLQRVVRHDEAAFDVLYARYAPQLQSYISRRLARHELIDDVLQEVMLVLWQRADKVPMTVPLGPWLCGVARYKTLKALARSPAPAASSHTDAPSQAEEPEGALLRHDHGRTLAQEIDSLPHSERAAIELLLQRYSYQEIAAATGDPVSTIRTRVARASQRLRTRIAALEYRPS